jgi:hypothetical protein
MVESEVAAKVRAARSPSRRQAEIVWSRKQCPSSSSSTRSGGREARDIGPIAASLALVASTKGSRKSGWTVSFGPPAGGSEAMRAISSVPSCRPTSMASVRFSLMVNLRLGSSRVIAGKISGSR